MYNFFRIKIVIILKIRKCFSLWNFLKYGGKPFFYFTLPSLALSLCVELINKVKKWGDRSVLLIEIINTGQRSQMLDIVT